MACLDSHHAPYGVVAPGKNDRELIGLRVAGDFQFFHTMLLLFTRHRATATSNILVSIAVQNAHTGAMHGDAIDRMVTYSFWGLGFLISAGIVLAFLIW